MYLGAKRHASRTQTPRGHAVRLRLSVSSKQDINPKFITVTRWQSRITIQSQCGEGVSNGCGKRLDSDRWSLERPIIQVRIDIEIL